MSRGPQLLCLTFSPSANLMPGGAAANFISSGTGAPAKLDHLVLSADRIGRAVQDVRRGDAAGQLAIDVDVGGIDEVADAHFGRDRLARFVDAAVGGRVRVAIDDAGAKCACPRRRSRRALRRRQPGADGRDFAGVDQQVGIFQPALRAAGPDRGVRETARSLGCSGGAARPNAPSGKFTSLIALSGSLRLSGFVLASSLSSSLGFGSSASLSSSLLVVVLAFGFFSSSRPCRLRARRCVWPSNGGSLRRRPRPRCPATTVRPAAGRAAVAAAAPRPWR